MGAYEKVIYGSTGEAGRDGLLSPDQRMQLNQIQERAAAMCMQRLDTLQPGEKFPLVAMATGIGKGRIIHRVIERQMRNKPDSKILIVAGTKLVLVDQTHRALSGYQQVLTPEEEIAVASFPQEVSGYSESEDEDEISEETEEVDEEEFKDSMLYKTGKLGQNDSQVHVATIQSVRSEIAKEKLDPDAYDLVVVDEAHNIGTKKRAEVISQFKRVVGFTATPYRYSGTLKDPEQYGFEVVDSLTLPEAQELQLLPPLCGIQIDTKDLINEIPMTRAGTINFKELEGLLKQSPDLRPYIADRVAKIISSEENKYKTVIAVNFVWEAQEMATLLKEKGIKVGIAINQQAAKELHTDEIPATDAIERYKLPETDEKSIQALVSPYVASEGFDAPFTEVLVWASPTDSPLRYTQYTGRLARRAEGKAFGVVVDCLYQTSQYNWSYNFGMWMKGKVKELDNGLLWLGSDRGIDKIKSLPFIERLNKINEKKSLQELSENGGNIQESDFPITYNYLQAEFATSLDRVVEIATKIVEEFKLTEPDLVVRRQSGRQVITVITDKDRFRQEMVNRGIKLRDSEPPPLNKEDFTLTNLSIVPLFIGDRGKIMNIARQVIKKLKEEDPTIFEQRKSKGQTVEIIRDPQRFMAEMLGNGLVQNTPTESIGKESENEFAITAKNLTSLFIGGEKKLAKTVKEVLDIMSDEDQEIIVTRKSHVKYIKVVRDKNRFIELMLERGAQLQSTFETAGANDFLIGPKFLMKVFKGDYHDLMAKAEKVINEISGTHPELVVQRRSSGKLVIKAIADRNMFISRMKENGARVKGGI